MCVPNASAFLRAQSEHGCVQLRIWLLEAIGCLWICCLKRWVQFVDGTAFSPKMTLMLVCVFSSNVAPSFSTRRVCSGLGVFMGIHTREHHTFVGAAGAHSILRSRLAEVATHKHTAKSSLCALWFTLGALALSHTHNSQWSLEQEV